MNTVSLIFLFLAGVGLALDAAPVSGVLVALAAVAELLLGGDDDADFNDTDVGPWGQP